MNTQDIKKMMEAYLEVVSEKTITCPKCKGDGCDHCDNTGKHEVEEAKKLDPVDDKEVDKKFKDRKDKDIDNDGDVDDSDEYLHKRRAATDDAIDARDDKKQSANKKGKTAEISKIGEKAAKKEDVDMDEFLAQLAEDFTEEQLDEVSQGLAKKAFDARARRIADLEKEKDRETNKHGRAQIDKEIGSQDKKLARSHSKSGSDKPLNKSYDDATKKKDTRSPAQKYADYKKDGGELDRDAFMKRQRESVDFDLSTNELISALTEAANPKAGATPPEGLTDKESPKSKEFAKAHDKSDKKIEDNEEDGHKKTFDAASKGTKPAPKRPGDNAAGDKNVVNPVKEDTRTYQQKIMDVLSGKTWGEIANEVSELKGEE